MGLFEVTKYVLNPSFHCPLAVNDISVNKDKWNELPPDLQAAFKMMTYKLAQTLDYQGQAESFTAIKELTDKGIVHTQLPDSEVAKARAVAVENVKEWREKSPMAAEMVDSILAFLKMRGVVE
jgi:TRAP-type mannitol/chloroaromatic compound transport system substrate-binding protein